MRCRFLEISVASSDVLASLHYYRGLGFVELTSRDVWEYPYAVISDGRINIGLHDRELCSPALSFVLPDLANALSAAAPRHLAPTYERTGDEQFHEAGFEAPDGQALIMLEARTFSPPDIPDTGTSLLGYFEGYALPCRDLDASRACWEALGFVAIEERQETDVKITLTSENLNLILQEDRQLREPALLFSADDTARRARQLEQRNFALEPDPPGGEGASLRGPEGLLLRLIPT